MVGGKFRKEIFFRDKQKNKQKTNKKQINLVRKVNENNYKINKILSKKLSKLTSTDLFL